MPTALLFTDLERKIGTFWTDNMQQWTVLIILLILNVIQYA
jgi:hypothetical protein